MENVREAYKIIGLPRGRAYLQEHDESFYCHVLNQKPELWSRKVGLFFLKDEEASFSELSISRKTKPATVTVKRGPKAALSIEPMERDRDFCHLMGEAMGNEIYSSVFLVSEEFDLAWADNSLRQLKKNQRRIFGGTNLFAQGACFSAREKVEERRLKGYLFLGNDLVRYNIGMEMMINGSPTYYALIAAGVNWYEAEKECELILDGTEELEFVVSSMESGKRNRYTMKLDGSDYKFGKKTVKKEKFTELYQALQSIMLDSEVEETKDAADKEEVLTVTFHRNTEEAPEVTLKYFAYDDTYDSLEINGTERFLVKAEDVDALVKQIKKSVLIESNLLFATELSRET